MARTKSQLEDEIIALKSIIEMQEAQIAQLKKNNSRGAGRKSKITPDIVEQVWQLYQYCPYRIIAERTGLSLGTIHKIIHSDCL